MIHCGPPSQPKRPKPYNPYHQELSVCPFTILVDTREQAPWTFGGIVMENKQIVTMNRKETLYPGDYSIEGQTGKVAIERKSWSDFVGSITAGSRRFAREHEAMKEINAAGGYACVIVEGSLSTICAAVDAAAAEGRQTTSACILGSVASWPAKYRTPWLFAGDRRTAELLAFRILMKQWERSQ